MLGNIGILEIIIIAVVIFVLFGGKKLPELARGISQASEEFKKGFKGEKNNQPKEKGESESQNNSQ